jgi:penicillin-binding protein 2
MANELKSNSYFTFDEKSGGPSMLHEANPGFFTRLKEYLSSRFAVLSLIFCMIGLLIFYNTAALQLNTLASAGISETSGVSRQMTVQAPRGDIVDASGIPLAYSHSISVLYLTYAGLDDDQLNSMLLDLAKFFEANNVVWTSKLTDYIDLSLESGVLSFQKSASATNYWQSDSNLFGLKAPDGSTVTFDDQQIKPTADMFFDYLLFEKFKIEDPTSKTRKYNKTEAFLIMKMRYVIFENAWMFRNGTPVEIARDVKPDVINQVNEQNYRFRGVISGQDSERVYTDAARSLSHVLGYTGRITSSQYDELKSLGYGPDAMVGQAGVELTAERYLTGKDGTKAYNIWTVAGEEGMFFSESIGKDAVPGYDIRLTIDLGLQKVAANSLATVIDKIRNSKDNKNKGDADAGAVVVLNVKSGAVLAMASFPDYDPNDFILQSEDKAAAKRVQSYLTDNQNKPMWNRAIMEIYAPGSTFKPATCIAALESGAITPTSNTIRCVGRETIANWPWHCLEKPNGGHGNLTLTRAIETSCNMYFYHLGVMTGIDAIDHWAGILGLGELTGIDLPGEAKGYRSSRATKKLLRSTPADQTWYPADTCQTAIGQFDNSFTIMQLATYTAALATGNKVTPHVIDTITRADGVVIKDNDELSPQPLGIKATSLAAVRAGMMAVASGPEGTARAAFANYPIKVAVKTGTAETGREDVSSSNGLFICYAPADNPQIAIAQIIEKGAWGANTIEIAKNLLDQYFGLNTSASDAISKAGIQP